MNELNVTVGPVSPVKSASSEAGAVRRLWERVLGKAGRLARSFDQHVSKKLIGRRWLASIYYAVMNGAFRRENAAAIAGRHRYRRDSDCPTASSGFLRRSIHRLEKGLLMRPRREVFGMDYIDATVRYYASIVRDPARCRDYQPGELKWAFDVLSRYFDVAGGDDRIERLKGEFRALPVPPVVEGDRYVPYLRDLSQTPTVSYDQLAHLSLRRRSVRWFLQERVPRQLIEQALAVATQSPSACNRQPFVFRVFDDPDLAKRIGAIPGGTVGFSHNFPAVAVVVGQLRNYADERDRHVIYIDGALASMSFVYALETLGLGSCCINWPDIEAAEREMAKALQLQPDERPIMLIAFGYPDPTGLVAYSQKKPVSQICRFNDE